MSDWIDLSYLNPRVWSNELFSPITVGPQIWTNALPLVISKKDRARMLLKENEGNYLNTSYLSEEITQRLGRTSSWALETLELSGKAQKQVSNPPLTLKKVLEVLWIKTSIFSATPFPRKRDILKEEGVKYVWSKDGYGSYMIQPIDSHFNPGNGTLSSHSFWTRGEAAPYMLFADNLDITIEAGLDSRHKAMIKEHNRLISEEGLRFLADPFSREAIDTTIRGGYFYYQDWQLIIKRPHAKI
jgi:hypothetical protein